MFLVICCKNCSWGALFLHRFLLLGNEFSHSPPPPHTHTQCLMLMSPASPTNCMQLHNGVTKKNDLEMNKNRQEIIRWGPWCTPTGNLNFLPLLLKWQGEPLLYSAYIQGLTCFTNEAKRSSLGLFQAEEKTYGGRSRPLLPAYHSHYLNGSTSRHLGRLGLQNMSFDDLGKVMLSWSSSQGFRCSLITFEKFEERRQLLKCIIVSNLTIISQCFVEGGTQTTQ